ncbi:MAG: hypothetical protein ABI690_07305 [Chloroflexota bacterium]
MSSVEIVDDILKEHMRHLLTILVPTAFPQFDDLIHDVQAHAEFNGCLLGFRGACLPVGNLTLIGLLNFRVLFAGHIPVEKHAFRGFYAPPGLGDSLLFLLF